MGILVFYLLLAIFVSFFCSIAEAVLLSVRPSYIKAREVRHPKNANRLKNLQNNINRPLAAILTANTIAHTVGAAGVGAQAAIIFGNQYLGLTSAILTFLILVFSEIIPKTLGATYWQQLAPLFAVLIDGLTKLLFPFVWLSEKLTRLISRSKENDYTFSRDEMKAMASIGVQEGMLEKKELKILTNLMRLHQLSVSDIMTPRTVVFSVSEELSVQEFFKAHASKPFSRIPVFTKNTDDVTGYVLKTDLLIAQANDQFDSKLSDFRRTFLTVPETKSTSDVFDMIMYEKSHIALVVNEYGMVQGVVSLEDILETLIGLEITDELDKVEDMQDFARNRWRERMETVGIKPDN